MYRLGNGLRLLAAILITGLVFTCGKSSDGEKTEKGEKKAVANADVYETGAELSLENAPFRDVLERAGYVPVSFRRMPAPVPGVRGSVLLYKGRENKDGGILYFEERADIYALVWHWYFDWVPVSADAVEINEDGLWDLRVKSKSGDVVDLIQDETFTLFGGERESRAALNCISSAAVDPAFPLWVCFDGDSSTAWTSGISAKDKAFIEWHTPLGLADGILSIRGRAGNEPRDCEIRADDKVVQHFELEQTDQDQLVKLDPSVLAAKTVKLIVASSYGPGDVVAISELDIK